MKKHLMSSLLLGLLLLSCGGESSVDVLRDAKSDGRRLFMKIDERGVIKRPSVYRPLDYLSVPERSGLDSSKGVGVYPASSKRLEVRFLGYRSASELQEMKMVLRETSFSFKEVELFAYLGMRFEKDADGSVKTEPGQLLLRCFKRSASGEVTCNDN